jgi:hypothetical protein
MNIEHFKKNYLEIADRIFACNNYFELRRYTIILDAEFDTDIFTKELNKSLNEIKLFNGDDTAPFKQVKFLYRSKIIQWYIGIKYKWEKTINELSQKSKNKKIILKKPKENVTINNYTLETLKKQGCFPDAWWLKQPNPIIIKKPSVENKLNNIMNILRDGSNKP